MRSPDFEQQQTILIIRQAALAVAEASTSCWPARYKTLARRGKLRSPLWAHCSPVAYVVRAACGGEILVGTVKGTRHFWNLLADGQEVDLTSCQFGGDGMTPLAKGEPVPLESYEPIPFQFLWFAHLVQRWLEKNRRVTDRKSRELYTGASER